MYRSTRMRVVSVRRGQFSHQSACIHARESLSCVDTENPALAAIYVHILTHLSAVCTLTGAHVWPQFTSLFTCCCCCCFPRAMPWHQSVPTCVLCVVFFKSPALTSAYIFAYTSFECCVLQESSSDVSLYLCLHVCCVLQESISDVSLYLYTYMCVVFFKSPALMAAYIYAYMCGVYFKSPALMSAYIYVDPCAICPSGVQLWRQYISVPTNKLLCHPRV